MLCQAIQFLTFLVNKFVELDEDHARRIRKGGSDKPVKKKPARTPKTVLLWLWLWLWSCAGVL